jgi:hypothetical protein
MAQRKVAQRKVYLRAMSPKQESHLEFIKKRFAELVDPKYRMGQHEHGGDLWRMGNEKLLDCAIEEAIDQVVYLLTLKVQLYESK